MIFNLHWWEYYVRVYIFITLGYIWYRFILLFVEDLRRHKLSYPLYNDQRFTVIMPFFNENKDMLKKSIQSIINAKGNKTIILVDDGSASLECYDLIKNEFLTKIKLIRSDKNAGKRKSQALALRYAKGDYIITIDSDTIVEKDALIKLIAPLIHDKTVGAATGNVKVYNENNNFLTKMISARYWAAFNIERKSLSSFGVVTCCSGVLSAYRSSFLKQIIKQYISQTFLGSECTYGDDRHLTNLVLENKYKINYVEDAICYTVVPANYKQFFIQQLRWKKSFIRESIISLKYAFTHSIILPVEILLNLLIPCLSILIRISIILSIIFYPLIIPVILMSIIFIAIIRNFILFFENKTLALYTIPYAFVHELALFWLYFIAIFTLHKNHWGTR